MRKLTSSKAGVGDLPADLLADLPEDDFLGVGAATFVAALVWARSCVAARSSIWLR